MNLGDIGPGGGIIIYKSPAGFTVTGHASFNASGYTAYYLEAAPAGWNGGTDDPTLPWASSGFVSTTIAGQGTAIGDGRRNTALILATDANAPAASACNLYTNNGFSDWFLPSRPELLELYAAQSHVTGLASAVYWTSSQASATNASLVNLSNGTVSNVSKANSNAVRPIRAF